MSPSAILTAFPHCRSCSGRCARGSDRVIGAMSEAIGVQCCYRNHRDSSLLQWLWPWACEWGAFTWQPLSETTQGTCSNWMVVW